MSSIRRVLVNISELRRVPVDRKDVYFLGAVGALVRLRSKRPQRDVRPHPVQQCPSVMVWESFEIA